MKHEKRTIKNTTACKLGITITVLLLLLITFILYIEKAKTSMFTSMNAIETRLDTLEVKIDEMKEEQSRALLHTLDIVGGHQESSAVIFTNYGIWDGHSTNTTASMLTIEEFEINEYGMYTYDGLVVLATANVTRLPWPLTDGYNSHELFETVEFELNDQFHVGVVIDVCGSCFGVQGEDKQRYDIFTVGNSIGKKEGVVYE